jgi:hypothetical protein
VPSIEEFDEFFPSVAAEVGFEGDELPVAVIGERDLLQGGGSIYSVYRIILIKSFLDTFSWRFNVCLKYEL